MRVLQLAAMAALIALCGMATADSATATDLRPGQRAAALFRPEGMSQALAGEFAITEVQGAAIAGEFSGPLCGPHTYRFRGRLEGDLLEATSRSQWGPIKVSARRTSAGRFEGTFTGQVPGRVEIEIRD